MLFKDDDGREFELSPYNGNGAFMKGELLIRPVKAEPKWEVEVCKYLSEDFNRDISIHLTATKDQAQLIKDWISEGMKYITGETDRHNGYIEAMDKARAALEDK